MSDRSHGSDGTHVRLEPLVRAHVRRPGGRRRAGCDALPVDDRAAQTLSDMAQYVDTRAAERAAGTALALCHRAPERRRGGRLDAFLPDRALDLARRPRSRPARPRRLRDRLYLARRRRDPHRGQHRDEAADARAMPSRCGGCSVCASTPTCATSARAMRCSHRRAVRGGAAGAPPGRT